MHQDLHTLVAAALADQHDFEDAWDRVGAAIDTHPRAPDLRRLRIQLADASSQRAVQAADLQVLCMLQPHNHEARLDLALLQLRWASWLVDDEEDDDGEFDDGEDEFDGPIGNDSDHGNDGDENADDDVAAGDDAEAALKALACAQLQQLLHERAHDAAFVTGLLTRLDDARLWQPWLQLAWTLQAVARHPADATLRRQLALAWLELDNQAPAVDLPEGQVPVGFAIDVYGQLHDALVAERALGAVQAALQAHPGDTTLHDRLAQLWLGLSQFPEASTALAAAAQAWQMQADAAQAAGDDEAADSARQQADEAGQQAQRCAQGRAALTAQWSQDMADALGRLDELPAPEPGDNEMLQALHARQQQRRLDLHEQWAQAQPQLAAAAQAPDADTLQRLQQLADTLAGQLLGAVSFAPLEHRLLTEAQAAPLLQDAHHQVAAELQALGAQRLGHYELPAYSEQFGHPAVVAAWVQGGGDGEDGGDDSDAGPALVSVAVVRGVAVVDVESGFSDGRQCVTTRGRGRNFLGGGPAIDTLHVDADQDLPLLLALHRARVRLALATQPGLTVQPLPDLAAVLALQEAQRQAKTAFRVEQGLSRFEALAIPCDQPEHFVPLVQAAALKRVRQAQADFQRLAGR